MVDDGVHDSRCQIRRTPSGEPDNPHRPLASRATALIGTATVETLSSLPVAKSQTRRAPRSEPETTTSPPIASARTAPPSVIMLWISTPVAASPTFKHPSYAPATPHPPSPD